MSNNKPDLDVLQHTVAEINRMIRVYKGAVGFSLIVDRETGVLEDVQPFSFPGYAIPPVVPKRPDVSQVFPNRNRSWKKRKWLWP